MREANTAIERQKVRPGIFDAGAFSFGNIEKNGNWNKF